MVLDEQWFTEIDSDDSGYAMSLKIKEKLHEERTPYQLIEVYETQTFGTLLVIDGCVMLTSRDNFLYHEMMSHPALFTHPAPKRVVIIGGGDCGTLREVLRHPGIEHVLQVEIDERVTRLSERFFPELCTANTDPRAEFHFDDGIAWMREAPAGSVDVIIVDSTDPFGPAEGLFGRDFYGNCARALGNEGLLVQQSESPLLHLEILQSMHREMHAAGLGHRRILNFPQPTYPSGWWCATLAGKHAGALEPRWEGIDTTALDLRYYNAAIHRGALACANFMDDALKR